MQKITQTPTHLLIGLFILLDAAAFICYHLYLNGPLESRFFRLGRDRGLFELIEYFKFYVIIAVFWQSWRISGEKLMKAWAVFTLGALATRFHWPLKEASRHRKSLLTQLLRPTSAWRLGLPMCQYPIIDT